MVQEVDGGRRDTVRQAKQAQPAVPIETPVWRAAAGDRGALNRTPVAPPWRRDRSLEKAAKK